MAQGLTRDAPLAAPAVHGKWPMPRVWLATLGAVFCVLLAPRASAEPLMIWHAYRGAEKQALEQLARRFEKEHGEAVKLLQVPHDAYASKLEAAAPRKHGPHVFIDSHERLGSYRERGVVVPLPTTESQQGDQFPRRALDALTHEGRLYGLPLAYKCLALYVNTRLVAEPPRTLGDLVALGARLPENTYPLVYEVQSMYFHAALLHGYGGRLLGEGGAFGFVGPPAERSVQLVQRLRELRVVPEEATGALIKELFAGGRAATAISGPWFASDIGDRVEYRVVPLPRISGVPGVPDGEPMQPYLTVEAAALTPLGAEREAARALLSFLAGAESAEVRARIGRQVVSRRELPQAVRDDAFLSAFAEQAESAVVMPASPRMRATWEPAERGLKKALRGTVTPKLALEEAERRFADVVRPLPERRSSAPLLLVVGVLCLAGAVMLVRRRNELGPALRRSLPAYAWTAHAVVAVGLLVILPIVVGAGISLYAGPRDDMYYVGLANFTSILSARGGPLLASGSFYLVLLVTVLWTVLNVALHVTIGFGLGLLLSKPALKLRPVYRVLLILPWAVPSYVTALAWKGMFSRQFGAVSALVEAVGGEPFSWWARFPTAFAANLSTNVWLGFPFMMVVTMGALTAVPKEVLEAAEVDGATRWQRLKRVTIPMVAPAMLPAVVLGAIWTFNMFNVVFLVSGGEPDGTTDILVSEAYRWAFTRQAQYGYAAAYAVLIFVLLAVGSRLMARMGGREAPA